MSVEYYLFPDRRESIGGQGPLEGDRPEDGKALLEHLYQHDWQYPAMVVFREGGDNRWSFAVINAKKGEGFEDTA